MKTIAYITDIHLNEGLFEDLGVDAQKNWELILADVKSRGITQIIFGGDIGDAGAHALFFNSVKGFDFRFVPGNHDKFAEVSPYFAGVNAGTDALYYALEQSGFKFIFLDTSTEQMGDAQLQWLQQALITDKQIVLFIHHPVLGVDTPLDAKYPLHGRDVIAGVLHNAGKPITIFCGHYHMPDVQHTGNITQYITPAASYQIIKNATGVAKDNSTFGYRLITINDTKLTTILLMYADGTFAEK